jgi:23S rRNA (cytidine1920-2'-O)/16S rRNA (cytidine1409-2'-O)-methyltransferase
LRLDLYLVENKLANSRTQAQDFISQGYVIIESAGQKKIIDKSNYIVRTGDQIIVEANELQKYVSRGGLKLERALAKLNINVKEKVALDIGQSTGGFTDCLLKMGARQVVGVDVGHSQLHASLKADSRIISFENLNVKDLSMNAGFVKEVPINKFDIVVADLSFISLTKVVPSISNFSSDGAEYLFLVKPQFECGPENLDKNGLVKNTKVYKTVEAEVRKSVMQYFKNVEAYFPCEVIGKDGNQEFFIYGRKTL